MSEEIQAVFNKLLPGQLKAPVKASAFAPSNIALSKYWGKRNRSLNLPLNSSLSLSLGSWGTSTSIEPAELDSLVFNGSRLDGNDPIAKRLFSFVDYFRRDKQISLQIDSHNTIPTAAGLASSASGFAALTLALDRAFQTQLPDSALSTIARIGSGSASRSLWHGFVRWESGTSADGMDSFAQPLAIDWPEIRMAIITISTEKKAQSSTEGMIHTEVTSPLFPSWISQATQDCDVIEQALSTKNFITIGNTAESNALAMHATMMAARPTLTYLKPESWATLELLWQARKDGLQAYATMDAGANVKILYLEKDQTSIKSIFPAATCIAPFVDAAII